MSCQFRHIPFSESMEGRCSGVSCRKILDAYKTFEEDLWGLYGVKPPVSKMKIADVTQSALKAIKLYKHVVQSVERFIRKCKPQYKLPGLYVMDSILRNSRKLYGPTKDVFAPRFAVRLRITFAHLFLCPQEDKAKIVKVLNLWTKKSIFPSSIIQPLHEFGNPNVPSKTELQIIAGESYKTIFQQPNCLLLALNNLTTNNKNV